MSHNEKKQKLLKLQLFLIFDKLAAKMYFNLSTFELYSK